MQPQVADLSGEISEKGHNATEKVGVSPLAAEAPAPARRSHDHDGVPQGWYVSN